MSNLVEAYSKRISISKNILEQAAKKQFLPGEEQLLAEILNLCTRYFNEILSYRGVLDPLIVQDLGDIKKRTLNYLTVVMPLLVHFNQVKENPGMRFNGDIISEIHDYLLEHYSTNKDLSE